MNLNILQLKRPRGGQIAWGLILLISAFHALYAFYMGGAELLSIFGLVTDAKMRAVPIVFVVHAITGGIALLVGPIQFNRQLLRKRRDLHRLLGKLYVVSIWLTSIGAFWSALFFDVTVVSKIGFFLLAILWFSTTTIAYNRIRHRQVKAHREWMFRSFALSFFFVTFNIWVPGLAGTSLPAEISYPLAVFLSWGLNLLVAEIWIRRTQLKNVPLFSVSQPKPAVQPYKQ